MAHNYLADHAEAGPSEHMARREDFPDIDFGDPTRNYLAERADDQNTDDEDGDR